MKFGLTLRNVLNKLFWDPNENPADYELSYIHRGAPQDSKIISCRLIEKVTGCGFIYRSEEEGKFFIPFHRILEIRNVKTARYSWKKQR